jgi:hypothetical protein
MCPYDAIAGAMVRYTSAVPPRPCERRTTGHEDEDSAASAGVSAPAPANAVADARAAAAAAVPAGRTDAE